MKKENEYDVVIIGSGLSGLTAGLYLQEDGLKTLILEKENQAGGLTKSWQQEPEGRFDREYILNYLNEEDIALQYPMHMIFQEKYPNLLDVYEHLGIMGNLTRPIKEFNIMDSRLIKHNLKMEDSILPAPLHAIKSIFGLKMGIVDKLSFLAAGLPMLYLGNSINCRDPKDSFYDRVSLEAFLKPWTTERTRDFIGSFTPSIYNLDSIEVNARRMAAVIFGTLFMSKRGMWYRLVNDNYTTGTIEPHVKRFEEAGGTLKLNCEVTNIVHDKYDGVKSVVFRPFPNCDCYSEVSAKYYIAAVRGHQLLPLIERKSPFRESNYFQSLAREKGACLSIARLFYSKKITGETFITGTSRRASVACSSANKNPWDRRPFSFNGCQDIRNIMPRYMNYPGSVVDVLSDRAEALQTLPIEKYLEYVIEDLRIVWPSAKYANVNLALGAHIPPSVLYHKEVPRLPNERNRFVDTPFWNLFGCNCSLGVIGIGMESAYQTGKLVANEILRKERRKGIKVYGYPEYEISALSKLCYEAIDIAVRGKQWVGKQLTSI